MSDYQVYTLQWLVNPLQYLALRGYCAQHDLHLLVQFDVFGVDLCPVMVRTVIKAATPEHAIQQAWNRCSALKEEGFSVLQQRVDAWIHDHETPPPRLLQRDLYHYTEFHITVAFVNYENYQRLRAAEDTAGETWSNTRWSLPMEKYDGTAKDKTLKMVAILREEKDDVAELWDRKLRFLELVRLHNDGQGPEHCQHQICILNCWWF